MEEFFSRARCTCPREAPANGLSSNASNTSSTGLPSSASMIPRTIRDETTGTSSVSDCNASM
eukprot:6193908-Pleurochrysis_carterae.AAC.1